MSQNIVLYTGESGYELFLKGKPFIASVDKRDGDYKVTAPVTNIVEFPLEDELESYDVVMMSGVIVEKIA